jgi:hypothetical protein
MTPSVKARLVITIGRKRTFAAASAASTSPALFAIAFGELDDQDRVLGAQADDRDEADAEEDIVRQAAHHHRRDRADQPEGTASITAAGIDQLS